MAKILISSEVKSEEKKDFSTTTSGALPKSSSSKVSSHNIPIIKSFSVTSSSGLIS